MPKSEAEQIAEIEKKMKQMEQRKKELIKRQSDKERKARTHRLIEKGAIIEKYTNTSDYEPEKFESICDDFFNNPAVRDAWSRSKLKVDTPPPAPPKSSYSDSVSGTSEHTPTYTNTSNYTPSNTSYGSTGSGGSSSAYPLSSSSYSTPIKNENDNSYG